MERQHELRNLAKLTPSGTKSSSLESEEASQIHINI
jgi:hypothetical protein